jgi:hypothetical protein
MQFQRNREATVANGRQCTASACFLLLFVCHACSESTAALLPLRVMIAGPASATGRAGSTTNGPTYECGPITLIATANGGTPGASATWVGGYSEVWDRSGSTLRASETWSRLLTADFWRTETVNAGQSVESRIYIMTLDQPFQLRFGFNTSTSGITDTARFTFTCN